MWRNTLNLAGASLALAFTAFSTASTVGAATTSKPATPEDLSCRVGKEVASPLQVPGMIEARHHAVISAGIAAQIVSLRRHEGETIHKGEVIVAFDCRLNQAQLTSARADLAVASQTLQSNRELAKHQAISEYDLTIATANRDKAAANLVAAQVGVQHCTIKAPYDGKVVATMVNENETAAPGTPLMSIVDNSPTDIRLNVPSQALRWIKNGTPFTFQARDNGTLVKATVAVVGAHIDPVNRSVLVIGRSASSAGTLISGMSGTAGFCGAQL